jgi:mono/diheme cytochrome c family protein
MVNLASGFVMIASVLIGLNSAAWAQDSDPGKSEFQSSCATCHGIDGEGKGPLSTQLKVPPTDLTVLAKKNNGVFPFEAVYEVIDGRKEVAAHGTRDMPIWGNRFANLSRSRVRSRNYDTDAHPRSHGLPKPYSEKIAVELTSH